MIAKAGLIGAAALLAAPAAHATTIFSNDFSKGLSPSEQITGHFAVGNGYLGHQGGYPNNDYSTYRLQLDMTGVTEAFLDFDYDVSTERGYDTLDLSVNGQNLDSYSGAEAGHARFALSGLTGLATILFTFHSDYLIAYRGVQIDNVMVSGTTAAAAVPETATWLSMIVGFGAVGYAMRRRANSLSSRGLA